MPHYLVTAKPNPETLTQLEQSLRQQAFISLRPFGPALTFSLTKARIKPDGSAVWEEEDYCSPPLAEERAAVLDKYFDNLSVQRVSVGEGWKEIESIPRLFPELHQHEL